MLARAFLFFARWSLAPWHREHTLAKFIRLHGLLNHDPLAREISHPLTRGTACIHVLAHVIMATTTSIVVVDDGVSFRSLQHPFISHRLRPTPAAEGNGSAYFIFRTDRIDNLQQRYVNVPSRTLHGHATFFPFSTTKPKERVSRDATKDKGGCRRVKRPKVLSAPDRPEKCTAERTSSRASLYDITAAAGNAVKEEPRAKI